LKKFIIIFIISFCFSTSSFSIQISDNIIWNNDTLPLLSNPLKSLINYDSVARYIFDKSTCISSKCRQGYYAEWQIIDEELYLNAIYSCCYYSDGIKSDLKKVFSKYFSNGKVKASWFTGNLFIGKEDVICLTYKFPESIYRKEYKLIFEKGKLVKHEIIDNSNTKKSLFAADKDTLQGIIYRNINWDLFPDISTKSAKVTISLLADANGKVDSLRVVRGSGAIYDNEALRVAKLIPSWDVYYIHGEFYPLSALITIQFTEANKKKYSKTK